MAGSKKVKFTKRLSVRLGALASVIVTGAIAIAQGQLGGDKTKIEPEKAVPKAESGEDPTALNPIAMPDDPSQDAAPRPGFDRFSDLPEMPPRSPVVQAGWNDEMVVRGNDDGTPTAIPEPDFSSSGFSGNATDLPDLPDSPDFDSPSAYSAPQPPATSAAEPTASASPTFDNQPPTSNGSEATSLQDASRSAIADAESSNSVYGGASSMPAGQSVYGDQPATLGGPVTSTPAAAEPMSAIPAMPVAEPSRFEPPAAPQPTHPSANSFAAPAAAGGAAVGAAAASEFSSPSRFSDDDQQPQPLASSSFSDAPPARSMPIDDPASTHAAGFQGDGTPGAESLDGRQSPALTIEKVAPAEIQVGKEAGFELRVRNVGQVAAHDVIVLDRVPQGTRFVNASPQSTQAPDGQLMWQLGTLEPGEETSVTLNVMPVSEGEIGSVAQVLFQTHASVRTICTKPELTVKHTGPARVLIGETVTLDITVSNPGTGTASGIILVEDVPEGLAHSAGKELEFDVGTLQPGETRQMQLTLKADKAGQIANTLIVRGEANLIARDTINVEVIAPLLQVGLTGPKMRYLEREATYEVAVANPGTAAARDVEIVTYLPKGMKFVAADHKGQYESQNHAVYWSLAELPPQQSGVAKLTLLPLETGEQKLSVEGRAELGLNHAAEKLVKVDSLAELQFTVEDAHDPIEIGSETTYVVTLNNVGSGAATNVRLAVAMPPELKPVGGDGPTRVAIEGTRLSIEPLARLAPGEQAQYKLRVRGLAAGSQRVQVQLITDETQVPVSKEEITRVYADH